MDQIQQLEGGQLPVEVSKTIATQLLHGLNFLPRECGGGIAHRDLNVMNVVLELEAGEPSVVKYLSSTSARLLETPEHVLANMDHPGNGDLSFVPLREVVATPLVTEMEEVHIRMIDFGTSS